MTEPLQETPRWVPLDFEAIERDGIPPLDWLLPGWIVAGDIFMFAGDATSGKSTTLSRLAYAAASCGEWCGIAVARKLRVLYVDEEQSLGEAYQLFRRHGPRLPAEDLRVFVGQGANLDSDQGAAIIEREVDEYKPALVLIDSATAAFGKTKGNSNDEVAAVFRRLFALRSKYSITTGFLHHLGKPGETKREILHRVLGSVAYVTQSSAVWGVLPHDSDSIELIGVKRRGIPRPYPSMVIGYREDGDRCYLENRGPVEDQDGPTGRAANWVFGYISGQTQPTKRQDLVRLGKCVPKPEGPHAENLIDDALARLVKKNAIQRIEGMRGFYQLPHSSRAEQLVAEVGS